MITLPFSNSFFFKIESLYIYFQFSFAHKINFIFIGIKEKKRIKNLFSCLCQVQRTKFMTFYVVDSI